MKSALITEKKNICFCGLEHYRQLLASGYLESAVQGQERERQRTQRQIRSVETRRIFNFPVNDRLLIRYSQEV